MSDFLSFLSCLADYFMDELGFVSGIINTVVGIFLSKPLLEFNIFISYICIREQTIAKEN